MTTRKETLKKIREWNFEEEGKEIEEDLKDNIQAEIEEEDIDIRKEVRGFEK